MYAINNQQVNILEFVFPNAMCKWFHKHMLKPEKQAESDTLDEEPRRLVPPEFASQSFFPRLHKPVTWRWTAVGVQ